MEGVTVQVVCQPSNSSADVHCPVCGQGFLLYWERTCLIEQGETLSDIQQSLADHHTADLDSDEPIHPLAAFNIPAWSGNPEFSGAAMLGGLPSAAR
jgi:hypothetical protein